jgi:hypothetical protein
MTEMRIEDIYLGVERIRLNDNVPESVRSHFEIARNLILYSWFVYSFNVVAEMQAFASLEMAVREITSDRKTPLKVLLDKVFKGRQLSDSLALSHAITKRRNNLAHGSTSMHGQGLVFVAVCSELINELFP